MYLKKIMIALLWIVAFTNFTYATAWVNISHKYTQSINKKISTIKFDGYNKGNSKLYIRVYGISNDGKKKVLALYPDYTTSSNANNYWLRAKLLDIHNQKALDKWSKYQINLNALISGLHFRSINKIEWVGNGSTYSKVKNISYSSGTQTSPTPPRNTPPSNTPSTGTPSGNYTPSGSIKTNWGFKGFTKSGESVTVHPGDSIQEIIDGSGYGDTVKFAAGTYYVNLNLKSNIILEGAGVGRTIIKCRDKFQAIASLGKSNIILRNMTIDGSNSGTASSISFYRGVKNLLIENIKSVNSGGTGIDIYGEDGTIPNYNVTIKNVVVINPRNWHGINATNVRGLVIDHATIDGGKNGIDTAFSDRVEISYANVKNAAQSFKAPGGNHIFVHDSVFSYSKYKSTPNGAMEPYGIKFGGNFKHYVYWDMRNVTVSYSGNGIMDASEGNSSFTKLVIQNVKSYGNRQNNIVARGVSNLYSYGSNARVIDESRGNAVVRNSANNSTPEADGVGYKSW